MGMEKASLLAGYKEDLQNHIAQDNLIDAIRKCDYILEDCIDAKDLHFLRLELWNKNGELSKTKQQIESFYSQSNGLFKYEPLLGYYKGQSLLYEGNEEAAKKIWQETMTADPEIRQIPVALKNLRQSKELKEEGSNLYKNNKTKEAIEKWEKSKLREKIERWENKLIIRKF